MQPPLKSRLPNVVKSLFLTAYLQVLLVAVNTYQISHGRYIGAVIVGFLISWVWTGNVRRISISTRMERVVYCTGAALGTVSGLCLTQLVYHNS